MRRFRFFALLLVLVLLIAPAAIGQNAELFNHSDTAAATVGRTGRIAESRVVVPNEVRYELRHCQAYAKTSGHWFWKKTVVDIEACAKDPSTLYSSQTVHNLRTNAGADWQKAQMGGTPGVACTYLGLANDTSNTNAGTVAATDTALNTSGTGSTEITANGFWSGGTARYAMTYTAGSAGSSSYQMAKAISVTGTQSANKAGMFTASTAGTMCFENLFTQVTVNNNDTLTVTWTINF